MYIDGHGKDHTYTTCRPVIVWSFVSFCFNENIINIIDHHNQTYQIVLESKEKQSGNKSDWISAQT